ncbi:MAG: ATP-binding protein [Aureliella sp.]
MPTRSVRASEIVLFIVDDDSDARTNLRDILELDGYHIAEAASAEALFELPDWDKVSLILLDRKLPDSSPEALLEKILKLAPSVSVIVVTGYADVDSAVTALRHGAADYILKPINPDMLRASIKRELEHQRSERQLRALYENTLTGLLIFDRRQTVLDANPAACAMLRTPHAELVGRSLSSLLATEEPAEAQAGEKGVTDSAAVSGAAAVTGSGAVAQHPVERKMRRGDGALIDVEQQAILNFSPGLSALSLRDITEKKQSEQRALQAERLAAIGETMTALVHESRNALQRSFACLEMLALEVEDRPAALDLVRRTQRAQNQLRDLYEEVRQWAAPLNIRRERANLANVWREAWHQVAQSQPDKKIDLIEDLALEPTCRVDASKMTQVFRNIFENAVEVSPDQSTITVRCCLGQGPGKNDLLVSIEDQGPGLTAEQCQRMFEPFYTTKTKGTGLGMAITKRIVVSHHGHIHAQSREGACISISLPRGMT